MEPIDLVTGSVRMLDYNGSSDLGQEEVYFYQNLFLGLRLAQDLWSLLVSGQNF